MADITAYGTIFAAFGCGLNYNSDLTRLEVVDSPKGKTSIVDKAVADISHFDDCANYVDGAAALVVAELIDNKRNPLSFRTRANVLEGLGLLKNSMYIYQVLSLQKNNRSWHYSDKENSCTWFGDVCVTRGVKPDPERKGRRSYRQPEEYHRLDGKGKIGREQLVTPALELLFQSIPTSNLISGHRVMSFEINLKQMKNMNIEDKLRVISELEGSMS